MRERSPVKVVCCYCGRRFQVPCVVSPRPKCHICRLGLDWKTELRRSIEIKQMLIDAGMFPLDSAPPQGRDY